MDNDINIAILDLYDGYPNEGMRCIKMLIDDFFDSNAISGNYDVINIRGNQALPSLKKYQIFISTGGPGSPIITSEKWEKQYFKFLDDLIAFNKVNSDKKHLFLICHSFQLMVQHFKFGLVCERKSTSFGVMPVHKTDDAQNEPLFEGLEDPYWAVDSRDYQVIQPDMERIEAMGAKILALEKKRPHIPLERAVMGIRLTTEIVGFQFHPEADAEGMQRYFLKEEKRKTVIEEYGVDKYEDMIEHLDDPDKIMLTESIIIPKFLELASKQLLN